jgi:hypothetical protein
MAQKMMALDSKVALRRREEIEFGRHRCFDV